MALKVKEGQVSVTHIENWIACLEVLMTNGFGKQTSWDGFGADLGWILDRFWMDR
jgi:hypothetical protein